nr:MAG TPA: Putative ATP dependent Clp protease [Caudoviricetes sp.]
MAKKINIRGVLVQNDDKWIYDWLGYEATCPCDVTSILDEANGDDVQVVINSGGGSVIVGHEIYTAIRNYKGNLKIQVIYAGSAASVVTEAAESEITPVGLYMIHNCSGVARGDYRDMDKESQLLQTINKTIRNAYLDKTGLSDEKLKELMDKESWLTAEEAVEYGFIDKVMFSESDPVNPSNYTNLVSLTPSDFCNSAVLDKNVLDKIRKEFFDKKNLGTNKPELHPMDASNQALFNTNQNKEDITNMNLEEFIASNPEVAAEIEARVQAASKEGATNERNRLQKIDNIASTIKPEMVTDAKYTSLLTAEELALKVISDSANAGKTYLINAVADSKISGSDGVETIPDEVSEDEDADLVNAMARSANKKRGGK